MTIHNGSGDCNLWPAIHQSYRHLHLCQNSISEMQNNNVVPRLNTVINAGQLPKQTIIKIRYMDEQG